MPIGNIPFIICINGIIWSVGFQVHCFYSRQILSILFLPSFEQDYSYFYYLILG
jgi:hypothetical protein